MDERKKEKGNKSRVKKATKGKKKRMKTGKRKKSDSENSNSEESDKDGKPKKDSDELVPVDRILDKRVIGGQTQYLVKYTPFKDPSWQDESYVKHLTDMIAAYEGDASVGTRTRSRTH